MQEQNHDLAIIGAGPVGALSALLAVHCGLRPLLLDAAASPSTQCPAGAYDLRVVALAPGSRALFEQVGAWLPELADRVQAYQGMEVWDAAGRGESARIAFEAQPLGLPELGHIVEVPALQWALDQAIAAHVAMGAMSRWQNAQFTDFAYQASGVALHCQDGRSAQVEWLVGADGRDSRLRKRAGMAVEVRNYLQQGVVAVLQPEQPHGAVARQAFTAHGPLGLLPLSSGEVSIVWSVAQDYAACLLALSPEEFCREVASACGQESFTLISRRVCFPLSLQHAKDYVSDALALVGDAAHVVHPLAGLGMNLGFEDAAALFATAGQATESRLRHYGRERRRAVLPALAMIDALEALFSSRQGEWMALRDWGLNLVNGQVRIKQEFMKYALGTRISAASHRPASTDLGHGEVASKSV